MIRKVLYLVYWRLTGEISYTIEVAFDDRIDAILFPIMAMIFAVVFGYAAEALLSDGNVLGLVAGILTLYLIGASVVWLISGIIYYRHYGVIKPAEERIEEEVMP